MEHKFLDIRRHQILDTMEDGSVMILYSGIPVHVSVDEYYPFEVNKSFFYLTEIPRENMILFLDKTRPGKEDIRLYIEQADPTDEKWFGKKLTIDEAKDESGIETVGYLQDFAGYFDRLMTDGYVKKAYFDTYRESEEDLEDYNQVKAAEFSRKYMGTPIQNAHTLIAYYRMAKDAHEVELVQKAVDITRQGLEDVMHTLKPGMMEYQAQANYEYRIKYLGASGPSFQTIAGSGYNGTMLHYETNQCECQDGELLLLDLGAKYKGYCSDITRTYPINGTYTKRQREVYNVVLEANERVAREAKPGMTTRELNDICKEVLAAGCKKLGLIKEDSELFTYYMHGVSHQIGLDVHDAVSPDGVQLRPGCIISNEPGLYIEEEKIGIRIEDDLLITETGCQVLSKDIIKNPDEIEAFMRK